ncbi:hypothetical protein RIR_jg3590.t1 [Rhizophagus irregularis DAOM 181602=DAOM 197198]|nr:hypothetical protein RIR_jg3590.t1 [Rhizophagus irregularis DAOM 181602=DAOM 197198]
MQEKYVVSARRLSISSIEQSIPVRPDLNRNTLNSFQRHRHSYDLLQNLETSYLLVAFIFEYKIIKQEEIKFKNRKNLGLRLTCNMLQS